MGLGRISEALQDFTGGVIEIINLQTPPPDVHKVLTKAHDRHSLMGASIEVSIPSPARCFLNYDVRVAVQNNCSKSFSKSLEKYDWAK